MKKNLLITLLVILVIVTGIFVFTACNDQNDKDDGTTIIDPETPLDPSVCQHANVQHQPAVSVSCTANGNLEYWYCPACQTYFSDSAYQNQTTLAAVTIVSQGHNYGTWIAETPADCSKNTTGVKGHYHCSNPDCGKNFDANKAELSDLVIPAVHAYGTWVPEVTASDCQHTTTLGHYYCPNCQQYFDAAHKIIPLPILNVPGPHHLTHKDAKPESTVNCGETYWEEEYWECDVCHDTFSDAEGINETFVIEGTKDHNYGTWIGEVSATCETDGTKGHYHCSNGCNKDYDDQHNVLDSLVLNKLDHNYGSLIPEDPATCLAPGTIAHYTCSRDNCGKHFDANKNPVTDLTTKQLDHNYGEWIAEKPATCEKDGELGHYHCSNGCDKNYDGDHKVLDSLVINKKGHSYGEFEYDYANHKYVATCNNDNTHTIDQAAGTEAYPYLAKDAATLNEVIALGGYVKLTSDITADVVIAKGKTVTLNLNGKTLSNSKSHTILNNGTLTLVGGGTVYNGTHQRAALNNTGVATVDGVTLERIYVAKTSTTARNSWYTVDNTNGGVMTFANVIVLTDPSDTFSSLVRNLGATMTIKSGVFNSRDKICVKNDDGGTLTIEDGTFNGQNGQAVQNWGEATIKNGTFDGDVTTAIWSSEFTSETVVTGGTFKQNFRFIYYVTSNSAVGPVLKVAKTMSISDPKIQIEEGENIGYTLKKNEGAEYKEYILNVPNGTEENPYLVSTASTLTTVIEKGGYVKLTNDITADVVIAKGKTVTLNLNGKTLSNSKSHTILNNGTLNLIGNGTVYNGTHKMAALLNKGVANVKGVTLQRIYVAKTDTTALNSFYTIYNNGKGIEGVELTLEDVTVLTDPSDNYSSLVCNYFATLTVKSGEYTNGLIAIKNDDKGVVTISDGHFVAGQAVQNWGEATIDGGIFDGDVTTAIWSGKFTSETEVNKGTFNQNFRFIYYGNSNTTNAPVLKAADGINVSNILIQIEEGVNIGYTLKTPEVVDNYTVYTLNIPTGTEENPYLVNDEASLNEALTKGGYVKLTSDITANDFISIGYYDLATNHTLDLNSKTLTSNVHTGLYIDNGANVTIKNGTITTLGYFSAEVSGKSYNFNNGILVYEPYSSDTNLKANVVIDNVTINVNANGINGTAINGDIADLTVKNSVINSNYIGINSYGKITILGGEVNATSAGLQISQTTATLTINDNAKIICKSGRSVLVTKGATGEISNAEIKGYSAGVAVGTDSTLTVNDSHIVATAGYGVSGNGNDTNVIITLNRCDIEAPLCVYNTQKTGKTIINGGTLTGSVSSVEVRAGEVEINGATLICTAQTFSIKASGNGSTATGVALAVSQHTTDMPINVTVTGSTLTGIYALYEKDVQNDKARDQIAITLGEGNVFNGCVYSENCENLRNVVGVNQTLVSDADKLIEEITKGGQIKLANDIDLTAKEGNDTAVYYVLRNNTVIDLNGYKITTKKGFSAGNNDKDVFEADLNPIVTVVNGTIERVSNSNIAALSAADCGELVIVNCTIISTGDTAVSIFDQGKVTAYHSTLKGVYYGFGSNAGLGNYQPEIYATLVNCKLDAQYAGLMWNIPGNLVVDGCEISGIGQAMIARGGQITVSNTTLTKRAGVAGVDSDRAINGDTSIYPPFENGAWGTGSSVPGYALVVGNRGAINVTDENELAKAGYQYATNLTLNNVKVVVEEEADAGKYVYAYGNTNATPGGVAYGATITYDAKCNLGNIVVGDLNLEGGSNVTINGQKATA